MREWDEHEKEFHGLTIEGEKARMLKDYDTAYRIFKQLIAKFPNEAASYIRLVRVISEGAMFRVDDDFLNILNKAQQLVESGASKYPMDKYNGMAELYFLRGVQYYGLSEKDKSFYDKADEQFNKALELDPSFEQARKAKTKNLEKKASSSGCFIATAVYGSPLAQEVLILKSFRDEFLERSTLGRLFITGYYRFSPFIALMIGRTETVKKVVRTTIISPLVRIVESFLK